MKTCIILAGGFGTRLSHLIPDLPKCLAPVADKPFLHYIIEYLISQQVNLFVFALGYKHELIVQYIQDFYPSLKTRFIIEDEPLGTGGAILKSLEICDEEHVFVVNGDTYFPINLNQLLNQHKSLNSFITIGVKAMNHPSRYGTLQLEKDQCIRSFFEKKEIHYGLINGGIYLIHRIPFIDKHFPKKFSFEQDVLEKETSNGQIFGQVQDHFFIDIGVPEDYNLAQLIFKNSNPESKIPWTLYLDRDGVINELIPGNYVKRWNEFKFENNFLNTFSKISKYFEHIFIVTNQQGVAKQYMTEQALKQIHDQMLTEINSAGGHISKIYYCPHLKASNCTCRKPNSGMLEKTKIEYPNLLFSKSILIGDTINDIKMAKSRGIITIAMLHKFNSKTDFELCEPDYFISDLDQFYSEVLPKIIPYDNHTKALDN